MAFSRPSGGLGEARGPRNPPKAPGSPSEPPGAPPPHAACLREVVVWDIVSFPGTARAIHRFEDLEPRPVHRRSKLCFVALGLGRAADPRGIGRGLSWRELP